MNVGNSVNLLSQDVAAGLYLYDKEIPGELSATAWFCQTSFRWFKLLTSRSTGLALSFTNMAEYDESRKFLKEFMWIAQNLIFRPNSNKLLPFQKAVLISTQTCLDLSEELLNIGYKFFMTSRVSTDCVENVFSQVRVKARKPSARQFAEVLRSISVANFVSEIETSNYQFAKTADSFSMIDFLETKLPEVQKTVQTEEVFKKYKKQSITLTAIEKNHVYYFAGFILKKVMNLRKFSSCSNCLKNVVQTSNCLPRQNTYNKLTIMKNYKSKKSLLVFPTLASFRFFCHMEKVVKSLKSQELFHETGCKDFFIKLMSGVKYDPFASCHDIKDKIISFFFSSRLSISLKQRNRNREQNAKLIY